MILWTSSVNLATIFVSELESALEFYTNTLGFRNISYDRSFMGIPGEYPPPGAEVSPVGSDIVIALRVDPAHVGNGRKSKPVPPRLMYWWAVLGLRTDDLHGKCRELKERGVEFFRDPYGRTRFFTLTGRPVQGQVHIHAAILDPDGNIIWLEEQLEEGDPGPVELEYWGSF